MISILQGSMWSGKTTMLKQLLNKAKTSIVFDCCNKRQSDRDLSTAYKVANLKEQQDYKGIDLVVFDEVHLTCVFDRKELFMEQLYNANKEARFVVLSGLLYDCYDDYEYFPIWNMIEEQHKKDIIDTVWLPSLLPCAGCGRKDSTVIYTRPTQKFNELFERVGDHYENICMKCARGWK